MRRQELLRVIPRCHARRWNIRRRGTEAGFTLVELAVALAIGITLLTLVLVSLTNTIQTGLDAVASGHANSNNNLALNEIQREVVSSDVIYNPATKTPKATTILPPTGSGGYLLRLLTNYKDSTTCVQWRLTTAGKLQFRSWSINRPTTVKHWETIVTGLLTTTPPFSTSTTRVSYGSRILTVSLIARSGAASTHLNLKAEVSASFPSLDAEFYPTTAPNYCTPPTTNT